MRRRVLLAVVLLLALGYVPLAIRWSRLANELRESRHLVRELRQEVLAEEKAEADANEPPKVLRSARPTDLITVISGGSEWSDSGEFPECSGSNVTCVDRVLAPCPEVEVAYSYGHMMDHVRFPAFRVKRGAMVDHRGEALTAQDIADLAKDDESVFDGGPDAALSAAKDGDRTRLVGAYTERGEIDVFRPSQIRLDEIRCTDRESRFEVIEARRDG